jgi:hypothetical protein
MRNENASAPGGLAGWLLARWRNRGGAQPRLALLERISLAPRQTLSLVEADGRRFLIASSPEGGAAFYPLGHRPTAADKQLGRISW